MAAYGEQVQANWRVRPVESMNGSRPFNVSGETLEENFLKNVIGGSEILCGLCLVLVLSGAVASD